MTDGERAANDRIRRYRTLTKICAGEWIDEDGTAYDRDGRAELLEYMADDAVSLAAEVARLRGLVGELLTAGNDLRAELTMLDADGLAVFKVNAWDAVAGGAAKEGGEREGSRATGWG